MKHSHREVVRFLRQSWDEEVDMVVADRCDGLRRDFQCHIAEEEIFHPLIERLVEVNDHRLQTSSRLLREVFVDKVCCIRHHALLLIVISPTLLDKLKEFCLHGLYNTLRVDILHEASVKMYELSHEVGTLRVYHSIITQRGHKQPYLCRTYLAGRWLWLTASWVTGIFYLKRVGIVSTTQFRIQGQTNIMIETEIICIGHAKRQHIVAYTTRGAAIEPLPSLVISHPKSIRQHRIAKITILGGDSTAVALTADVVGV